MTETSAPIAPKRVKAPDLEAKLHFSQPFRQIVVMLSVVGLVAFGIFVALPQVLPIFMSNVWFNGTITLVFFVGVLSCFAQVFQLIYSVRWLEGFATDPSSASKKAPRLLAPLANLLRSRGVKTQIAASSTRSILDSVATRVEEAREVTRYIVNLLIFLGLLGTFYGLATTVPALVETIRSLAPQDGESGAMLFGRLMDGLESQLDGMGVAFASSLLGLAGSLVVGLLELFAGHGQNRFYRELEEWLSSITRLGFASGDGDAMTEQGMVAAVLDQVSEQIDAMQTIFMQSDVSRSMLDEKLGTLASTLDRVADRLEAQQPTTSSLERLVQSQESLVQVLGALEKAEAVDAESRMRLRSIDVQMLRMTEEIAAGRAETVAALRAEISSLTQAIVRATDDFSETR